jgi:hypothetical protein
MLDAPIALSYNVGMGIEKPSVKIPENLTLTHDGYFGETFQAKRIAQAFLKKVLPPKTVTCLNLAGLIVESRHLGDDMFKEAIADIVYRVPIKGTKEHVNFLWWSNINRIKIS